LIRDYNLEAEMTMKVIGLDIAKHVFQVHGVNETGKVVVRRKLRRADVLRWFADIDPTIIGIEDPRRRTTGLENLWRWGMMSD
jgi:transposase